MNHRFALHIFVTLGRMTLIVKLLRFPAVGLLLMMSAAGLPPLAAQTPTADASAADPIYRIEVILFNHTGGRSDALRTDRLNDFSDALDPLDLAEALAEAQASQDRFNQLSAGVQPGRNPEAANGQQSNSERELRQYLAEAQLSEPMQAILDRLERSDRYQPLTWRSWLQTLERGESTRWVRLHNERRLQLGDGPEASMAGQELDARAALEPDDTDPTSRVDETLEADRFQYELDGQIRVRQRQFMHVYFDLEWRQAAGRPAPLLQSQPSENDVRPLHGSAPSEWLVHRFEQSRIVRPERIEYFDSAWLGAIVLIRREELPTPVPTSDNTIGPAASQDTTEEMDD